MSDVPSHQRGIVGLPRCRWNMKPLEERLAEADKLRGVVPDWVWKDIREAIRDSAEDFGEREVIKEEPHPVPEIRRDGWLTTVDIQRMVAWRFEVTRDDIKGTRRRKHIVRARHIAMYLTKLLTRRSLPEIGRLFGGRHHTTVMHAVRKIEGVIEVDRAMAREIRELIVALRPDS